VNRGYYFLKVQLLQNELLEKVFVEVAYRGEYAKQMLSRLEQQRGAGSTQTFMSNSF
jgi:hypothetical protein